MSKVMIVCLVAIFVLAESCSRGKRSSRSRTRSTETVQTDSPRSGRTTVGKRPSIKAAANGNNQEMSGADIFARYNNAVFTVYTSDGYNGYQGSGFFISSDGLAVSNYHVFEGTYQNRAQIKMADGSFSEVSEIIDYSADDDVFVFRVKSHGKQRVKIPISKRKVRVGERAYAIGSPKGLENTFSSGEISQLREGYIQISVPIDHGSSGGVLLNAYGEAIGITTAGRDDSGANLNFAVDIHVLEKYIDIK